MMRIRPILLTSCLALTSCGCSSPDARQSKGSTPQTEHEYAELSARLTSSPPKAWVDTGPAALSRGPAIVPFLIAALEANRGAEGEQAVLGILGALPHPQTGPFLLRVFEEDSAHSSEAALSMGRLGYKLALPALRAHVANPKSEPVLRTAAAAALLDLGDLKTALPFLQAVILASTPDGIEAMTSFGLQDKARWALERTMAIAAIERHSGQSFGLDPDLSWPDLATRTRNAFDSISKEAR